MMDSWAKLLEFMKENQNAELAWVENELIELIQDYGHDRFLDGYYHECC